MVADIGLLLHIWQSIMLAILHTWTFWICETLTDAGGSTSPHPHSLSVPVVQCVFFRR